MRNGLARSRLERVEKGIGLFQNWLRQLYGGVNTAAIHSVQAATGASI
jgi:hypothetical protein